MATEPRPEGPYVLSGDAQSPRIGEESRPAFLDLGQRLTHQIRVEALGDGYGSVDYYVVCACGWVSDPFVRRQSAPPDCGIDRAVRYGARGVRNYGRAQARGVVGHD